MNALPIVINFLSHCLTSIRRRAWLLRRRKVQRLIRIARYQLLTEWWSYASTQERGRLLPEQYEALSILRASELKLRREADYIRNSRIRWSSVMDIEHLISN